MMFQQGCVSFLVLFGCASAFFHGKPVLPSFQSPSRCVSLKSSLATSKLSVAFWGRQRVTLSLAKLAANSRSSGSRLKGGLRVMDPKQSNEVEKTSRDLRNRLKQAEADIEEAKVGQEAALRRVRELEQRIDAITSGSLNENEWKFVANVKRAKRSLERSWRLFVATTNKASLPSASSSASSSTSSSSSTPSAPLLPFSSWPLLPSSGMLAFDSTSPWASLAAANNSSLASEATTKLGQLTFLAERTGSSVRILSDLAWSGKLFDAGLQRAVTSNPLVLSHAVGFYSRAAELERHVPNILPILERHLVNVEPHLDEIMEQFDKIEPHLAFVLTHIDVLAPHCGALMRHLEELLLYADESSGEHAQYFPELLPYIEFFAPRLDVLASKKHLTNLRPHLPKLSVYVPYLAPLMDRIGDYPVVSANADVLVWYFGWVLRVPGLRRLVYLWFLCPGTPWFIGWLARHLPKRPVRGQCSDVECIIDGEDVLDGEVCYQRPSLRLALKSGARELLRSARRLIKISAPRLLPAFNTPKPTPSQIKS
mmetsp:Transcript_70339/g.138281  ORF Transcript_70339/g.138281 Transcript_70339/m.138281 type:complete len:539 (+) Transcript_70339:130-1746(+)